MNRPKTPAIMIQGVSSNAGKSVLTAALGRILQQDGLNPAPFKAQNMSSHLYAIKDRSGNANGSYISATQAVQAFACKREPEVRMNPVLLKPVSNMGSEVMLLGKNKGHMKAREYQAYKDSIFASVTDAYDALAAESGIMVLEGAGSPAEINLREHDIVNMRMAKHANAAVLLVGDIDRGGVFAHLYGTYALLQEDEKQRIKGFILNRFRGDSSLLAPALEEISALSGVPFIGTIPYLPDLGLPEEDSLSGPESPWPSEADLDKALNRLADFVRKYLDMPCVYRMLGITQGDETGMY